MKKITVTLSTEAEKYFIELMYSFAGKDGASAPTQSDCINESLETLSMFEKETNNQLRNWLSDFRKLSGEEQIFVGDPAMKKGRFKLPPTKTLIDIAMLFNDGKLDTEKLADMVGYCQLVIDRLYENGNIMQASSKEKTESQ